MGKINIAKLLKDCPKGTKLYSLVHGEVELTRVGVECIYCIPNYLKHYEIEFNLDGRWVEDKGECILFPSKENRDWGTFQRPFKDGDILYIDCNDDGDTCEEYQYIFILKNISEDKIDSYCYVTKANKSKFKICYLADLPYRLRHATEEEKQKLFKAIKDNGYKWNAETKTLEKLIIPKFKVGDRVRLKSKPNYIYTIHSLTWDDNKKLAYRLLPNNDIHPIVVSLDRQDNYELVTNKFDISTLKPFDKVLVRNKSNEVWTANFYSHYDATSDKPFICVGWSEMNEYRYCIPYEVNNELLGTTNNTEEYGTR